MSLKISSFFLFFSFLFFSNDYSCIINLNDSSDDSSGDSSDDDSSDSDLNLYTSVLNSSDLTCIHLL